MKIILALLMFIVALAVIYFSGPKVSTPDITRHPADISDQLNLADIITSDLSALEQQINQHEKNVGNIKTDNEARIIWADSSKYQKTPYSLVYLHGFSASQGEGDPLHHAFAQRYGCNLYLARLQAHGLESEEPLLDFDAEKLIESGRVAVKIGKELGDKVILMSTSTGGTVSLALAAEDPDIDALILYSPNIDIADPSSALLLQPWGLQLARLVIGGKYRSFEGPEGKEAETEQYWTTKYRIESLLTLKSLVHATMNAQTFSQITQPTLACAYYKSEEEQDDVVSVSRIKEMYQDLGTPPTDKQYVELPEVANHGMASKYWSKDIPAVKEATFQFAEDILSLNPIPIPDRDSL